MNFEEKLIYIRNLKYDDLSEEYKKLREILLNNAKNRHKMIWDLSLFEVCILKMDHIENKSK